jgi:ABC-2 type transport system permease protein
VLGAITTFNALAKSGFRRYSTYRQATFAAAVTNTVFGFLHVYVLLAAAAGSASGAPGGYRPEQLVTYIWIGQGLLGVVMLWGYTDLSDRIRTGDIATDLLRPVHPVAQFLAVDIGRATHAMLTRFVPPVLIGHLAFDGHRPGRWWTVPAFLLSVVLAVVACFACRYLVNAVSYWWLDNRGVSFAWVMVGGVGSGLYFPLRFLPDWLLVTLWVGTPLPGLIQTPIDVLVERASPGWTAAMVAGQAGWAVALLATCHLVQRRAEHRMVVQGG